jgi:hypothetical protein
MADLPVPFILPLYQRLVASASSRMRGNLCHRLPNAPTAQLLREPISCLDRQKAAEKSRRTAERSVSQQTLREGDIARPMAKS